MLRAISSCPRASFLRQHSRNGAYFPQPVLVLVEQQDDVLQEQQDEQEHELEHQPGASCPKSLISSISKVVLCRSRISF